MSRHLEVALAGLLHDVGKLAQRAHAPGQGLGAEATKLADYVCPSHQGRQTHRHAAYTAHFILEHMPYVPESFDRERVLRLAAYHHRPTNDDEQLVTEADRLSARMEREDDEDGPSGRNAFRRVKLRAVSNEIDVAGRSEGNWSLDLLPLAPDAAFPKRVDEPDEDLTPQYQALWSQFLNAWECNRVPDPWAFLNRAMSILEHYTWCIPAATNAYPDISLYDHLKTTAAIAAALAMVEAGHTRPFLLVSADMGGIQDYLFGIQAGVGGLARRLRARSLFVSLAVDNIAHFILRELGLPLANCILSAGGRFTLLLPNNSAAVEAVDAARHRAAEWATDETGNALHPHLATVVASRDDLTDFGAVLEVLGNRLHREKARPLADALVDDGQWDEGAFVLDALSFAEGREVCQSCLRRTGTPRQVHDRTVAVCDDCQRNAEDGRRLVKARYISFSDTPGSLPFGSYELTQTEKEIPADAYLALDMDGAFGGLPQKPVMGRCVARHVARDADGSVTEFEELAASSTGRKALAYLKADVDNLGLIFSRGLRGDDSDRSSISRLSTLSRSLELFFSGYVQQLAAEFDTVYTVYSGGDDMLMVGPWSHMLKFAARLRDELRRFTCGSPSWSLSAGVVVVGDKTPVLTAAEEAETRLEAAKSMPGDEVWPWSPHWRPDDKADPSKDRLVAFGTGLPWERALCAIARAEDILAWLEDGALSTGQVRRLLSYARMFQTWQRTGDVMCFRYAPMLVYDLKRNWGDAPGEAMEWASRLTLRHSEDMPVLRFVCEYALYGARSKDEGNDGK